MKDRWMFVRKNIYRIAIRSFSLISGFILAVSLWGQESNESSVSMDTIRLKEIVVSSNNKNTVTGALSGKITIDAEGIKNIPSLMGNTDILKALELMPGVQTSGDGNSNLYIRGGDAGQNVLLYNGNRIYTPGHILSFFPLFNIDHLSSLQLQKSGVSSQYGDFLGSVIVINGKEQIPTMTSVKGNVGLLSSQSSLQLPINEKFGAYVSGRVTYLDLLLKPLLKSTINNNSKSDMDDIGCDFYDINATLIGKLSANNLLLVDVFASSDKMNLKDDEIALNGNMDWKNTVLSARLRTRLSDDNNLQQSVRYSRFENTMNTSQADMGLNINSSIEDIGYRIGLEGYIGALRYLTGLDYSFYNILPQFTNIDNTGLNYQTENLGRITAHSFSPYISSFFTIDNRIYAEPGIRLNYYTSRYNHTSANKDFFSVDYRLALRYRLMSDKYFRMSFSHNNQYVNKLTPSSLGLPTDFWVIASKDIKPQKGNEFSVGYYQLFQDGLFELSSDVYFRNMRDITEFNQSFIESDNQLFTDKIYYGKGKSYGWELMLKKNMGKLTGWISYSLGRSDRNFKDIDKGKTFPAKYDRTHDLSVVLAYGFNTRWDASLTYIYATGNTYTQPSSWYFMNGVPMKEYGRYNNSRMPAYNRTDINVNYWFRKNNGLNFSLYNLFAVNNPIYIFLLVSNNKETEQLEVRIKKKNLFTIIPSISWKYEF